MLTNSQMIAGRFAQVAKYRRFVATVRKHVEAGSTVFIQNGHQVLKLSKPAHLDCITSTKGGVFVRRGKSKVCIFDRLVAPSRVWAE